MTVADCVRVGSVEIEGACELLLELLGGLQDSECVFEVTISLHWVATDEDVAQDGPEQIFQVNGKVVVPYAQLKAFVIDADDEAVVAGTVVDTTVEGTSVAFENSIHPNLPMVL